jgi:alkylation response protein AidB-like acyl-CoA dehydrogenase
MSSTDMEDVDAFRSRARAWLAASMPRRLGAVGSLDTGQEDRVARHRQLQRTLFDGGFAGIVFPVEYGGLGLTPAHQRAFTEEAAEYEMPLVFNVPTLGILAATLLEFGTEEQKRRHIPAILRGDELWVQFLSEPSGGSDLAGCITRATQDGDVWILNGSKIWSSGAHWCDWAMCLARTNWDVPKHRGLTMFIVEIHQPGIQVDRIRQVAGSSEFCQEFFDDVAIPAAAVVGAVNDGWTVASRLLFHERNSVGGASPYVSGGGPEGPSGGRLPGNRLLADQLGVATDPEVGQLLAESYLLDIVHGQLADRMAAGMRSGAFPGTAGAILRLFSGEKFVRQTDITMEIAGVSAAAAPDDALVGRYADQFLGRQGNCLGGGSTEMARNIISERVLGMPREYAPDRHIPFNQVKRNELPSRP